MPVCLVNAFAALSTANVSAGPELPIRAVSVVASNLVLVYLLWRRLHLFSLPLPLLRR